MALFIKEKFLEKGAMQLIENGGSWDVLKI